MAAPTQATINKLAPKIEELMNERTQTDALYCVEPKNKRYTLVMLNIFAKFFYGFSALIILLTIACFIFVPIESVDDKKYMFALSYLGISILLIAIVIRFYVESQIIDLVLLYEDKIIVTAKNKSVKQFSYGQVSETIRRNGVIINNGYLELKLDDYKLKLEVLVNDNDYLDGILKLLADKTGIEMPVLSKKDKLLIQRTKCLKLWLKIYLWCFIGDIYFCSFLSIVPSENNLSFIERISEFFTSYISFSSEYVNYFDYHMMEAVAWGFGLLLIPAFFINISPFKKRFSGDKLLRIK